MKKHRIWYGITTGIIFLIYILANRQEILVFLISLLIIPPILILIQLLVMRGFDIQCHMKTGCRVDEKLPFIIEVSRRSFFPMGVIHLNIKIKNILYDSVQIKEILLQPVEKKEMKFEYPLEMNNCGAVQVSVEQVRCYDLLGLFYRRIPVDMQVDILVYPAQLKLNMQLMRRPQTSVTGNLYDQHRKGQDVSEVAELREYREGDSLGKIHWKLSGKMDELIVRDFGYPSNYTVLILYDMMKNVDGVSISNQRNNAILAVTNEVSYRMIELHLEHNVGRVFNGDIQMLPVYSLDSHDKMLYQILCQSIVKEESRGDTIYHFLQGNMRGEYTKIVYITTEYEERNVRQLAREIDLTVIQVVDGADNVIVDTSGYSVIAVDAGNYKERVHNIAI